MADGWEIKHQEGTYVEGVGNEVLLGLGASLAIFIPIVITFLVKRTTHVQIHPAEAEHVRATRERLGVGENVNNSNQDFNRTNRSTPPRNINAGEPCPICLGQPRLLVVTNCGHGFCGENQHSILHKYERNKRMLLCTC